MAGPLQPPRAPARAPGRAPPPAPLAIGSAARARLAPADCAQRATPARPRSHAPVVRAPRTTRPATPRLRRVRPPPAPAPGAPHDATGYATTQARQAAAGAGSGRP